MLGACEPAEGPLELRDPGALGDQVAADRLRDGGDVRLGDLLPTVWQERFAHAVTAGRTVSAISRISSWLSHRSLFSDV